MVNALTRDHNDIVQRLPRSLLIGAKRLPQGPIRRPKSIDVEGEGMFAIRRVSEQAIELEPFGNLMRNVFASGIGVSLVMGTGISILFSIFAPAPLPPLMLLLMFLNPWMGAAFVCIPYFLTRHYSGKFRGGFIRIHRGTRRLYVVTPRDQQLRILEWDQIQALAGYVPTVGAAGYSSQYPLYLIAVDWNQTPPAEVCVSCGNLGWRDGGSSAKELWDCLRIFMEHGADALPQPPPIPPRLPRKETFLRFYRDWADKYRRDLATPKGKRWAALVIPAKILALICIVFPDSLAEFIEYNVPYTSFPKEIDALCGFNEKRVPIMRLNGERIDS
ncbi:hypothetical protein N8H69_12915 [Achromobacter spanius]|uniref:DUF6708 domain-containing protein n=1 Tax=Achromobacter spanius TaxID=217203 RepID=UPI0022269BB7|nr:hypothetical protein [Achromobacter spanius]MCW3153436.1 hypothetical protein [Achromobacter spanius]